MFSVPPRTGAPVPGLRPCRPLLSWLEPIPLVPPDAGALFEPPQAAAVIASTARPATAREPRVRVRIVALSSFRVSEPQPTSRPSSVFRRDPHLGHRQVRSARLLSAWLATRRPVHRELPAGSPAGMRESAEPGRSQGSSGSCYDLSD